MLVNKTEGQLKELPIEYRRTPGAFVRGFLGEGQCYWGRTLSGRLTAKQKKDLKTIGISAKQSHYHKGLVTLLKKRCQKTNIIKIKAYLEQRLEHIDSCLMEEAILLINAWHTAVCLMSDAENKTRKRLRGEQNLLMAQLATRFLPIGFISTLADPVQFTEHTAPYIGLFLKDRVLDELDRRHKEDPGS